MKALDFLLFVALDVFLRFFFFCDIVIYGGEPIRLIMPFEFYMTITGVY